MSNLIIKNARVVTPVGKSSRKGAEMKELREIPEATIVIEGGKIVYVGGNAGLPELPGAEVLDAKGHVA